MNRLILGDCLEELTKLAPHSVDSLCTDPPYGDNTGYGRHNRTIINNTSPLIGLQALEKSWSLLKKNTLSFFFLDIRHLPLVERFVAQYTDFRIKDWVVWDKRTMGMGHGFRRRHELILALEKGRPQYANFGFPNVLTTKRVDTSEHPHKKPIALIEALINHATRPKAVILDPFTGVGTTCLAAKSLGRGYIGIERDGGYFKIAKARLAAAPLPATNLGAA